MERLKTFGLGISLRKEMGFATTYSTESVGNLRVYNYK